MSLKRNHKPVGEYAFAAVKELFPDGYPVHIDTIENFNDLEFILRGAWMECERQQRLLKIEFAPRSLAEQLHRFLVIDIEHTVDLIKNQEQIENIFEEFKTQLLTQKNLSEPNVQSILNNVQKYGKQFRQKIENLVEAN